MANDNPLIKPPQSNTESDKTPGPTEMYSTQRIVRKVGPNRTVSLLRHAVPLMCHYNFE